jgi:hypothetical protein
LIARGHVALQIIERPGASPAFPLLTHNRESHLTERRKNRGGYCGAQGPKKVLPDTPG